MNTQKTKIPKQVLQFFLEHGTLVDDNYSFFPYWLETVDKDLGVVILHRLGDDVPEELKEAITNERELKDNKVRMLTLPVCFWNTVSKKEWDSLSISEQNVLVKIARKKINDKDM